MASRTYAGVVLLPLLLAQTAIGQAAAGGTTAPGSNAGTAGTAPSHAGAAPSRANGGVGTGSRSSVSNTQPDPRPQGNATGGNGGATSAPAPAATGRVEITGSQSKNQHPSEDHPLLPMASLGNALGIRSGAPIRIKLQADADSGHVRNGDMLDATLTEPLGGLPAGTPVRLTVVQSSKAGQMLSFGELSLQVVSIGRYAVLSDTITALGKEGPKEQPDAAPARGTEAIFPSSQTITLPAA